MANLVKNFFSDFEDINEYYMFLVEKTKQKEYVGITTVSYTHSEPTRRS